MRVEVWHHPEPHRCAGGWSTIEIGDEEFRQFLSELVNEDEPQTHEHVLRAISRFGVFLRSLPGDFIASINPQPRSTVAAFLRVQADRFDAPRGVKR